MLEYPLYKEQDKQTLKLIRDFPNEERLIERYSRRMKKWIPDIEMAKVYFGGIEVRSITEEEANRLIREVYNVD
jgi:predicted ATP-grasp superfamily ATP-dependent carboligase